jgi:hypothetical protein
MHNVADAIALTVLWNSWVERTVVLAFSSARKEQEVRTWFANTSRVAARLSIIQGA